MKTNRTSWTATLLLFLASVIWGFAMVAQSIGAEHVGPWTFVFARYALGALVLAPASLIAARRRHVKCSRAQRRQTLRGGLCCGLFLGFASIAQQAGVRYTSAGKAGFITALYVVIVPLLGLFVGRKPEKKLWFCVLLGLLGLYLISVKGDFTIGLGDGLVMLCAILFSGQILSVDRFSRSVEEPLQLAAVEFSVAALVGLAGMLLFEQPRLEALQEAWLPIVYAGVLSGALGYSLQIIGQKHTDPTVATLLMSLEAVFSALAGWMILHQVLSLRELLGCAAVLAAVLLAQLPLRKGARYRP